jgi:hypothetical protein
MGEGLITLYREERYDPVVERKRQPTIDLGRTHDTRDNLPTQQNTSREPLPQSPEGIAKLSFRDAFWPTSGSWKARASSGEQAKAHHRGRTHGGRRQRQFHDDSPADPQILDNLLHAPGTRPASQQSLWRNSLGPPPDLGRHGRGVNIPGAGQDGAKLGKTHSRRATTIPQRQLCRPKKIPRYNTSMPRAPRQ